MPMLPRTDTLAGSDLDRRMQDIARLHPKLIDLSLDRIRRLLAALEHPEERLPPVIHVAGTNGKGSTIAFLRAMAEAAGWRTHVYISPHLVRFNERIRLAGRLADDAQLIAAIDRVQAVNGDAPITHFEFVTALAFHLFAQCPAELLLLETGLGGRCDATNVIATPAVTAITRISYDHCAYLGNTLTAIAGEKAGIMKPGRPVIVAPQADAAVSALFREKAAALESPLFEAGRDWRVELRPNGFRYRSAALDWSLPAPSLLGLHQYGNAGTAIACLERLSGFPLSQSGVAEALGTTKWPGRLQRLGAGPYAGLLPAGSELWLDGAHNDSGGEVLAAQAEIWRNQDGKPLDLIVGMLKTKDPQAFIRPLRPFLRSLCCIQIPNDANSASAQELHAALDGMAPNTTILQSSDPYHALQYLKTADMRPGRIVICGSLHLAGYVLRENGLIPD